MKLHKALKTIIQTEGNEIIKDLRLVNILDDYNAYADVPASKYILKAIIEDGYAEIFLRLKTWDSNAESLVTKFANITGFIKEYVFIIFQSIAFGLGWIVQIKKFNITNSINDKCILYNQKKHIQLFNYEINGSLIKFCSNLEDLGYKKRKDILGGIVYGGKYLDIDSQIVIYEPTNYNRLSHIDIITLAYEKWYEIKKQYIKIKNKYSEIYGNPEEFEFENNPDYDGSGKELSYIKGGEIFGCIYTLPTGTISISIFIGYGTSNGKSIEVGSTKISYIDRINSAFPIKFQSSKNNI